MTEAALFYELAHANLGDDFLDDVRFAIDSVRERPKLGVDLGYGFRRVLVRRFPFSIIYFADLEQHRGPTARACTCARASSRGHLRRPRRREAWTEGFAPVVSAAAGSFSSRRRLGMAGEAPTLPKAQ